MAKGLAFSLFLLAVLCATALAAVPVTGEIPVNTQTTDQQVDPSVAMDADGDFAVVWEDRVAANREIRLRRFTRAGAPTTGEITVDALAVDYQRPAAAMSAAGAGVVAYQRSDTGQVLARRFDADSVEGSEFPVDASTAAGGADIALDSDGDFVVVWRDDTGSPALVRARRFDETGAPQGGGAFTVNAAVAQSSIDPVVAIDTAGNFAVAWERAIGAGDDDVYAKVFNADGSPRTGDLPIATGPADQDDPEIAMDASGDFAIGWESGDPNGDILARRFNSAGAATTAAFMVHSAAVGQQDNVGLGLDAAGASLSVAWDTDTSAGEEVRARRFGPAGNPLSGEIPVNTTTAGDQKDAALGADATGRFAVAWESPASNENIFARRFDLPPPAQPGPGVTAPGRAARIGKVSANGKRVTFRIRCLVTRCTVRARGTLSVPSRALASKRFKLRSSRKTVLKGKTARVTLKLTRKGRRAARKAFAKRRYRRKLRARVTVSVTGSGGAKSTFKRTAKVKPPKRR